MTRADATGTAAAKDGAAPALAPEAADLLRRLIELGMRPYDEIGVLRARHAVESSRWMQGDKLEGVSTRDVLVAGGDGRVPARVYHPDPGTTLPLTVWFHGGGWVAGSVAYADRPCRAIAKESGTVVVSVEYRRPPETPFPGPLDDAVAATTWLAEHAADLGADATHLTIAGDSAGGNLAAAAARRLRGRLDLQRQLLVYPALAPPDPEKHPSHSHFAQGYMLTAQDMAWFWRHYLDGRDPVAPVPPDAAPLFTEDLDGLAPTSIAVAGFDPLRDEGMAYAERLRDAGIDVHLREWPEMIHGFLGMGGELAQTAELIAWIAGELKAAST
ncbi:alpha/beta hydrolase [Actinomycetospora endophytica]|uniref:Alpha/beta hydrolase n=1 Tax=Actinomycetospora endophytica TaxID=2291215 RepID=A0ABS8PI81_9PSEU|nr:alpha/beta hydrolase [Actinomycetospora endophytica]MCD2197970.1 alpha/beta hydrolase [Actinomycetospora endophytica]